MKVSEVSSKVTCISMKVTSREMQFHVMRSTFPILILLSSASSIAPYGATTTTTTTTGTTIATVTSSLQRAAMLPFQSAPTLNSTISLTFNSPILNGDSELLTVNTVDDDTEDNAATDDILETERRDDSSFELNDGSSMRFPLYLRLSATAICLLLLAIGCPGNLLVPYVVMKTKELRNSTNIFLMNLSVSDLMILLISSPTILIELHSQPETWFLGLFMCK